MQESAFGYLWRGKNRIFQSVFLPARKPSKLFVSNASVFTGIQIAYISWRSKNFNKWFSPGRELINLTEKNSQLRSGPVSRHMPGSWPVCMYIGPVSLILASAGPVLSSAYIPIAQSCLQQCGSGEKTCYLYMVLVLDKYQKENIFAERERWWMIVHCAMLNIDWNTICKICKNMGKTFSVCRGNMYTTDGNTCICIVYICIAIRYIGIGYTLYTQYLYISRGKVARRTLIRSPRKTQNFRFFANHNFVKRQKKL